MSDACLKSLYEINKRHSCFHFPLISGVTIGVEFIDSLTLIWLTCTYADRFPPNLSISKAAQLFKDKNLHKLLPEFSALRKRYWGQHMWARGYWVASSGNVTDEVWKKHTKSVVVQT
ncbi:MAG TPA: hypothetical protein ENJ13_04540 [Chromatiales bacterium]|nr:hypothetical protein [Chromatiales bacterium]